MSFGEKKTKDENKEVELKNLMTNVNDQKKSGKKEKKKPGTKISLLRNNSIGSGYNDNDENIPDFHNEDFKSKNKAKIERMRHRAIKKKCILYPED